MKTNAQRAFVGALALLGGCAALWFNLTAEQPEPASSRPTARSATAVANDFIQTGYTPQPQGGHRVLRFGSLQEYEAVSRFGRLPASLSGASANWNVAADAKGKLIPNADLAALFEFFLSAHTEEGLATALGRIEEYLRSQLPEAAATEAMKILRDYLAYKQGLTRFEPSTDRAGSTQDAQMATIADVKAAMVRRSAARRQHLGAEVADVFFKADEAYDAYTVQRLEAQANTALSAADREAAIVQAEQLLPPDKRARVQQERKEAELNLRIAALQAQGGNADAILKLRTELYGAQEAQRLAVVDQEQAAWTARLQNYRNAKASILNQAGLSADAKALSIEELEKARFSAEELREVRILEGIRTPQSG